MNHLRSDRPRSCFSHALQLVAAAAIATVAACGGSGESDDAATPADSVATASTAGSGASDAAPIQLDLDPCGLLTIAEMESAIGSGVEEGGLEDDNPASCTFSIGGSDVGAGVIGISAEHPLTCAAILRALDSGSLDGTNSVKVDVGDGGVAERDGGTIQFAIGGGCIGIRASTSGVGIDQAGMVKLAEAAAGRVAP